jgi:ATP/maltotriose-dependent transcriptional regulator MalT
MFEDQLGVGHDALAAGRWSDARTTFEAVLAEAEHPEACFGLAVALWWLGENDEAVRQATTAYALYRHGDDAEHAIQCAVWLAITYKANFANPTAAGGWLGRAERLLASLEPSPLHGWAWIARAYRQEDLEQAAALSERALDEGRRAGDVDLELVALSQLGLIRVGQGEVASGFALIDEAVAAALAGEGTSLDTVVYACCDMLNACELADDLDRAAAWCQVADRFVDDYGCPFLNAECRIYYGSVLAAKGRWEAAERELGVGLSITEGACPGLHVRALVRLARLRIRQGRLEEADALLTRAETGVDEQPELVLASGALLLARGDSPAAGRLLEQRLRPLAEHRSHLVAALDLLVDAQLGARDLAAAEVTVRRLTAVAGSTAHDGLRAIARAADGRTATARGEVRRATSALEDALATWARLEMPYEAARARLDLANVNADTAAELAVEYARQALAAFEALGAALDADRTAALLRSLGVVPRVGAKGVGVLTRREREVLDLLAGGLSNPEIAARLHVSRKTASHHVSSILAKLHLRNRAEAAAYATANRDR